MRQSQDAAKAALKSNYERNKARPEWVKAQRAKAIEVLRKRNEFLAKLKDFPCMDCGIKYPPAVMEFHHRDPSTKVSTVSSMACSKMAEEAAKCDLTCANCHRMRHHGG